jgi:hypothetical protein
MRFPGKLALLAAERVHPVLTWLPLGAALLLCGAEARASFERAHALVAAGPPLGAWVRASVWAALAALGLPFVVGRAAGLARRWRLADAEWLAPSPLSPASIQGALLAGTSLAAFLLVALGALAAEAFAPAAPGLRWAGTVGLAPAVLAEGAPPATCEVAGSVPARGTRLAIRPTLAPGSGQAVSLCASLASASGEVSRVEARIHGRTTLELAVPDPDGAPLRFTLERSGPGAVLVLPGREADLLAPLPTDRSASLALGVRAWLALAAWMALAAGLGAWMRTSLAALLVLSLALLALAADAELGTALRRFLPGGDLALAYARVAAGVVPPGPDAGAVLADLAGFLAGLVLLRAGLGVRRDP